MPQATQWPAWPSLLVGTLCAIWKLLKQEIKQQVLKSPDSSAVVELASIYSTKHSKCVNSVACHQPVVTEFSIAW